MDDSRTSQASGSVVPPEKGRNAALVSLTAGLLVLAVVPAVLLLAGVLRLGRPAMGKARTAARIDSDLKPDPAKSSFSGSDERVYCCAAVRAFEDTMVSAHWYRGSTTVAVMSGRFGELARRSTTRFLPTDGEVAFYLDKPPDGWQAGSYTVRLSIGDRAAGSAAFTISGGGGIPVKTSLYRDPAGLFTVEVPGGWAEASRDATSGTLAEFTSTEQGDYPPRFAVVQTGLPSATAEDLNSALKSEGVGDQERFTAVTLGDLKGARRTYEWDYQDGDVKRRLRSTQVVVNAGGKILAINCHSLASDYEGNLPTFDAVVNSFRVGTAAPPAK